MRDASEWEGVAMRCEVGSHGELGEESSEVGCRPVLGQVSTSVRWGVDLGEVGKGKAGAAEEDPQAPGL